MLKRWQDQVLRIQKAWKVRTKIGHATLIELSVWMDPYEKITYPIGEPLALPFITHFPAGPAAIPRLQCSVQAHSWAGLSCQLNEAEAL